MRFLPKENITYRTKLKEAEIINRLNDLIETGKNFRIGTYNSRKPYAGKIDDKIFKIRRIIGYRNSFLPIITGLIERDQNEVTITVKMKLSTFVKIFLFIWCGVVGLVFFTILATSFLQEKFNQSVLLPFLMLLFAYGLTMLTFKFESRKAKKDFEKLFDVSL